LFKRYAPLTESRKARDCENCLICNFRQRVPAKPHQLSVGRSVRRPAAMLGIGKRFVYVLRSEMDPSCHYVGLASDIDERLRWHNTGPSGQTVRHTPWKLLVSVEFADEPTAFRFERYLKSGSGRAFTKRHFAPVNRADLAHPPIATQTIVRVDVTRPIATPRADGASADPGKRAKSLSVVINSQPCSI
jgi:putative endonuclease